MSNQIIDKAKSEARTLLTEVESKELLRQAGLSIIDTRLATSKKETIAISKELGFPVVLKIASPDIVHKNDAGGVKLGLKTALQVEKAYDAILKSINQKYPKADIKGVSVQKMARPGVEVIIGMNKDAQFGPVIMFGLGGVWVEIMKDVSFRIVPLTKRDAAEMKRVHEAVGEIFELAIKLGGTLTGEHGIGLGKMKFLTAEHGEAVSVMRAVKMALDPQNIMNPGKIFTL